MAGYISQLRNSFVQDKFRPLHLRYLSFDPNQNNFRLLLDKGDIENKVTGQKSPVTSKNLETETKKLLNYFFIGLTLPNSSFWVNLRPDSENNIIDDKLAQTDVGKILLEADLQLKKDTAKFTSPETAEGREYWNKLYQKAGELFGSSDVSIPTLTRPWIVPDEIIVRETPSSAYVYKATLKVMLEQDYLKDSAVYRFDDERLKELNEYSSQLIRELIIPKLTKEINNSKRYASLRQVYYSLILAQWFKNRKRLFPSNPSQSSLKETVSDLIDSQNLAHLTSKQPWSKDTYFNEYQKSFKDGEYNIKESVTTLFGRATRSYFSGGIALEDIAAQTTFVQGNPNNPLPASSYIVGMNGTIGASPIDVGLNVDPQVLAQLNQPESPAAQTEVITQPATIQLENSAIKEDASLQPALDIREIRAFAGNNHILQELALVLMGIKPAFFGLNPAYPAARELLDQADILGKTRGVKKFFLKNGIPVIYHEASIRDIISRNKSFYEKFGDTNNIEEIMQRAFAAREQGELLGYGTQRTVDGAPYFLEVRNDSAAPVIVCRVKNKEEAMQLGEKYKAALEELTGGRASFIFKKESRIVTALAYLAVVTLGWIDKVITMLSSLWGKRNPGANFSAETQPIAQPENLPVQGDAVHALAKGDASTPKPFLAARGKVHGLFVRNPDGTRTIYVNRTELEQHLSDDFARLLGEEVTVEQATRFLDGHETLHAAIDLLQEQGRAPPEIDETEEEQLANLFGQAFALGHTQVPQGLLNELQVLSKKLGIDPQVFLQALQANPQEIEALLEHFGVSVELKATNLQGIRKALQQKGAIEEQGGKVKTMEGGLWGWIRGVVGGVKAKEQVHREWVVKQGSVGVHDWVNILNNPGSDQDYERAANNLAELILYSRRPSPRIVALHYLCQSFIAPQFTERATEIMRRVGRQIAPQLRDVAVNSQEDPALRKEALDALDARFFSRDKDLAVFLRGLILNGGPTIEDSGLRKSAAVFLSRLVGQNRALAQELPEGFLPQMTNLVTNEQESIEVRSAVLKILEDSLYLKQTQPVIEALEKIFVAVDNTAMKREILETFSNVDLAERLLPELKGIIENSKDDNLRRTAAYVLSRLSRASSRENEEAKEILRTIRLRPILAEPDQNLVDIQKAFWLFSLSAADLENSRDSDDLRLLGKILVRTGRLDQALEIAGQQRSFDREYMLDSVAKALASQGELEKAEEVARQQMTAAAIFRVDAFIGLAGAYADSGRKDKAEQLLDEALDMLTNYSDQDSESAEDYIRNIRKYMACREFIKRGNLSKAEPLVRSITDYQRKYLLGEIALKLCESGKIEEAQALERTLEQKDYFKAQFLCAQAKALLAAGKKAEAQAILEKLSQEVATWQNNQDKRLTLIQMAQIEAQLGNPAQAASFFEEAKRVLEQSNFRQAYVGYEVEQYLALAKAMVVSGMPQQAEAIFQKTIQIAERYGSLNSFNSLLKIAKSLREVGNIRQARVVLDRALVRAQLILGDGNIPSDVKTSNRRARPFSEAADLLLALSGRDQAFIRQQRSAFQAEPSAESLSALFALAREEFSLGVPERVRESHSYLGRGYNSSAFNMLKEQKSPLAIELAILALGDATAESKERRKIGLPDETKGLEFSISVLGNMADNNPAFKLTQEQVQVLIGAIPQATQEGNLALPPSLSALFLILSTGLKNTPELRLNLEQNQVLINILKEGMAGDLDEVCNILNHEFARNNDLLGPIMNAISECGVAHGRDTLVRILAEKLASAQDLLEPVINAVKETSRPSTRRAFASALAKAIDANPALISRNKENENFSQAVRLLVPLSHTIQSRQDLERIVDQGLEILTQCTPTGPEVVDAIGRLAPLLEEFPSTWEGFVKPVVQRQRMWAYLSLETLAELNECGAISSEEDLNFVRGVIEKDGREILSNFAVLNLTKGDISSVKVLQGLLNTAKSEPEMLGWLLHKMTGIMKGPDFSQRTSEELRGFLGQILPEDPAEMDSQFLDNFKLLLVNGLAPLLTFNNALRHSRNHQALIKKWQGYNPQINLDFDPDDPIKVALEYNRFLSGYMLYNVKPDDIPTFSFSWFKEMLNKFKNKEQNQVSTESKVALSYTSYEVKKFFDFVVQLKRQADRFGRKVMVVPNFSYGWFLMTPIRERLEDLGILVVDARVGSSESHNDEYLIAGAHKEQMFDDKTLEFIVRENPIIVMADGSNSFMRGNVDNRYPDAHKAFVNNIILLNYALAGGNFHPDPETFRDDEAYLLDLLSRPDAQALLGKIRKIMERNNIQPRTNNAYGTRFFNPNNFPAILTMGGRWAARQARATPVPFRSEQTGTLDYKDRSDLFVATINTRDEDMPAYMKELNHWAEHQSASIDDHIQKRFTVDERGLNPSHTFDDEFKRQYLAVEQLVDEKEAGVSLGIPVAHKGDLSSLPFSAEKKFRAVLLDIDGTIKPKGEPIPREILDRISAMLNAGYKVGIVTGRSDSVKRVFIERMKRRVNGEALKNLTIFEQNGAKGYNAGTGEAVALFEMELHEKGAILERLNQDALRQFNFKISERSGIIALDGFDEARTKELMRAVKLALIDSGMDAKYTVVNTGVNLNIVSRGVNKGFAAREFARVNHLNQEDILKLGDSYGFEENDYYMLVLNNGVGVDDPDTTLWLLDIFFKDRTPPPETQPVMGEKTDEAFLDFLAEEIRQKYDGFIVGVAGAADPSAPYTPAMGEELGKILREFVNGNGFVMTGGVDGVGVDVYRGIQAASAGQSDRFFALLPQGMRPSARYNELSPRKSVNTEFIGTDMFERRIGMGKVADVLIVQNGGAGTLHEAISALSLGKKIVVLDNGGAGSELYNAKLYNQIPSELAQEGLRPEHLERIMLADMQNIRSVLSTMVSADSYNLGAQVPGVKSANDQGFEGGVTSLNTKAFDSLWEYEGREVAMPAKAGRIINLRDEERPQGFFGPGFHLPTIKLITRAQMNALTSQNAIRQGEQVLIVDTYWNNLSDETTPESLRQGKDTKLNLLMHEAMASWCEQKGIPAEDIPMLLEGLPKALHNEEQTGEITTGFIRPPDQDRQIAHQGIAVDRAMEGEQPKTLRDRLNAPMQNKSGWVRIIATPKEAYDFHQDWQNRERTPEFFVRQLRGISYKIPVWVWNKMQEWSRRSEDFERRGYFVARRANAQEIEILDFIPLGSFAADTKSKEIVGKLIGDDLVDTGIPGQASSENFSLFGRQTEELGIDLDLQRQLDFENIAASMGDTSLVQIKFHSHSRESKLRDGPGDTDKDAANKAQDVRFVYSCKSGLGFLYDGAEEASITPEMQSQSTTVGSGNTGTAEGGMADQGLKSPGQSTGSIDSGYEGGIATSTFPAETIPWQLSPLADVTPLEGVTQDVVTIGDIHADLEALRDTMAGLGLIKKGKDENGLDDKWIRENVIAVQGGDSPDRGLKPLETLKYLRLMQQKAVKKNSKLIRIIGNHELMYLLRHAGGEWEGEIEFLKEIGAIRGIDEKLWDNDTELVDGLREDIRNGNLQAVYDIGGKVFSHGVVSAGLINELEKTHSGVSNKEIFAETSNRILRQAVEEDNFDNIIFSLKNGPVSNSIDGITSGYFTKVEDSQVDSLPFDEVVFHDPRHFYGNDRIGVKKGRLTSRTLTCADAGMTAGFMSGRAAVVFKAGKVYAAYAAFDALWQLAQPEIIPPEFRDIVSATSPKHPDGFFGRNFRYPEIRLISRKQMDTLSPAHNVLRSASRVLIVKDYWNKFSLHAKINLLMHEAMADWSQTKGVIAEDIPMMLEGLPKDGGGFTDEPDKIRQQAHQGIAVDRAMEGETAENVMAALPIMTISEALGDYKPGEGRFCVLDWGYIPQETQLEDLLRGLRDLNSSERYPDGEIGLYFEPYSGKWFFVGLNNSGATGQWGRLFDYIQNNISRKSKQPHAAIRTHSHPNEEGIIVSGHDRLGAIGDLTSRRFVVSVGGFKEYDNRFWPGKEKQISVSEFRQRLIEIYQGSAFLGLQKDLAQVGADPKAAPGGIDGSTSSPSTPTTETGGVDFRGLPIVTQPMPGVIPAQAGIHSPGFPIEAFGNDDKLMETDPQWQEIERMQKGGIIPSYQRLKDYLMSACNTPDCQQKIRRVLSCIADILRLEEDEVEPTRPVLKEMLILLDSGQTAGQLQIALAKIEIPEEEPAEPVEP